MVEAEKNVLNSPQKPVRFFTLVILVTSVIFLFISVFPLVSNNNPQNFIHSEVQGYELEKPEVVNGRFAEIKVLKSDEVGAIYDDFTVIWSNADTDLQKFGAYDRLYGILWAKYNITKDLEVRMEMNKIESFLSLNWPQFYKVVKDNKGFME